MRLFVLALFLGAPLLAQTPPPPDQAPKTETPAAPAQPGTSDAQQQPEKAPAPGELHLRLRNLQDALKKYRESGGSYFAPPATLPMVRGNITLVAPGRPCAIPLVNVLRSVPRDRMVIPAVPSGADSTPEVRLPAPSCEDGKR